MRSNSSSSGGVSGGHMGTSDNIGSAGPLDDAMDLNNLMNDDGSSGGVGGGQVTIRQNDDFTSALSITSVTRAQSGTYTCRVQNDAATVSHSALLRVNVPPRISPFNFEDEITEGMRTQLMCSSSQGDQPFNITWLKDDAHIVSTQDAKNPGQTADASLVINEYSSFSSILSIHNVSSRHNGNYTCRISNRAGVVEYTAKLSVSGKYAK